MTAAPSPAPAGAQRAGRAAAAAVRRSVAGCPRRHAGSGAAGRRLRLCLGPPFPPPLLPRFFHSSPPRSTLFLSSPRYLVVLVQVRVGHLCGTLLHQLQRQGTTGAGEHTRDRGAWAGGGARGVGREARPQPPAHQAGPPPPYSRQCSAGSAACHSTPSGATTAPQYLHAVLGVDVLVLRHIQVSLALRHLFNTVGSRQPGDRQASAGRWAGPGAARPNTPSPTHRRSHRTHPHAHAHAQAHRRASQPPPPPRKAQPPRTRSLITSIFPLSWSRWLCRPARCCDSVWNSPSICALLPTCGGGLGQARRAGPRVSSGGGAAAVRPHPPAVWRGRGLQRAVAAGLSTCPTPKVNSPKEDADGAPSAPAPAPPPTHPHTHARAPVPAPDQSPPAAPPAPPPASCRGGRQAGPPPFARVGM